MQVEIDSNSGFCFGVVNAIQKAEEELQGGKLYCIGDIVHNNLEVSRLRDLGLVTIDHDAFSRLRGCRVLFRAHGEPPSSYEMASLHQVEVIDASCPVVLHLQRQVREAYGWVKRYGGQLVIYGKPGHAEVIALVAQTRGEAMVVEKEKDLEGIDFSLPVILFSQTTQSLDGFQRIVSYVQEHRGRGEIKIHDTICRKVANRIPQLQEFARQHDVILFVSDGKSSNGMQLFSVCREVNDRSFFIQSANDLREEMTANAGSVGITGATSTPKWVMNEVRCRVAGEGDTSSDSG